MNPLSRLNAYIKRNFSIDTNYYFTNGSWLMATNVFTALVSILFLVVATRLLSVQDFGRYNLFLTILSIVGIFSLTGMTQAILQSAARGNKNAFVDGSKHRLKFSLIGSVIMIGVAAYFYWVHDAGWPLYLLSVLLFPLLFSFDSSVFYLYGINQFRKASVVKFVLYAVPALAGAAVLLLGGKVEHVMLSYLVSLAVVSVLVYFFTRSITPDVKHKEDKGLFHYGFTLTIINGISVLYMYIDKLILTYFLGYAALALYYVAEVLPTQANNHAKIIMSLLTPRFSAKKRTIGYATRYISYAFFASFIMMGAIYLVIPYIVPLIFGASYAVAVPYAQLLCFAFIFFIPFIVVESFFQSQKKLQEMYVYKIGVPVVGFAVYALAVIYGGLLWLVYARIAMHGVTFFTALFLAYRHEFTRA